MAGDTTTTSRERRVPRKALGAVLLAAALAVALGSSIPVWLDLAGQCPGWDSEGTIAALESPRGRVLCTDTGNRAALLALVPAGVLAVLALWLWLGVRRFGAFVLVLVLVAATPALAWAGLHLLSDECSSAQEAELGDRGCGRDLEGTY